MAEALRLRGNEAFARQEFTKAAKIYRDAIKLDQANPVLYSNRAICFIKIGEFDRALKDCDLGLGIATDSKTKIKLLYRKHLALVGISAIEQAISVLQEAKQLDPTNSLIVNELKKLSTQEQAQKPDQRITKESTSSIVNISIAYVDEIPSDFNLKPDTEPKEQKTITELTPSTENSSASVVPTIINNSTDIKWPTISMWIMKHEQVSTETPEESQQKLEALLSTSFGTYSAMFNIESRSGITGGFLNFMLDLIYQAPRVPEKSTLSDYVGFFATCRRFDLSKLLVDADKLKKAESTLQDETIFSSWK